MRKDGVGIRNLLILAGTIIGLAVITGLIVTYMT